MLIGGLQKISLIDFAPHISCVVFTRGCNLACPYCHNPELVSLQETSSGTFSESDIFSFLEKRKAYLDAVVISGGEPSLQPDLVDFCANVKKIGYLVKVDTNGTRPDVIRELISSGQIDYIAMDVKTDPERYFPHISSSLDPALITESIGVILDSGIPHEFRTTCVKSIVDRDAIVAIADLVHGADLYALQIPVVKQLLDSDFFDSENRMPTDDQISDFLSILSPSVNRCIRR